MESKKLNFGCGTRIMKGYVNLDVVPLKGVDVVHDLNKFPYPFKKNYFDEIYARNILEHLDDLVKVMKELHRVLKPKGKLIIEVPYQTIIHTWASFQHKRAFTLRTFDGFAKKTDQRCKLNVPNEDYGLGFAFSKIKRKLHFPRGLHIESYILEPLANLLPRIYEETFLRYIFPAFSIVVELEK